MPDFPLVPAKTAMLFFDTLNVYLHPEDKAAQAAIDASGIIPRMQRLMEACRAAGVTVCYGQADHRPDGRDFAPLIVDAGHDNSSGPRKTTGTAAHANEWNIQIIDELAPRPEDYVIKKHRWSTFFQTHFELSLRTAGIDTIMFAGGSTEVGIASTAYAGRDMDFNQIVLRDACSSSRAEVKELYMNLVFPKFARVMTTHEAIALING